MTSTQLGALGMQIKLARGEVALVDPDDYEIVAKYSWHNNGKGYAIASVSIDGKRLKVRMHRMIMGLRKGDPGQIDHINGNKLDNRRCNLRICTVSENNCNVGVRSNSKSGYKGVSWNKQRNRWHSRIGMNGKVLHLGYFDTAEEAHIAYRQASEKFHGSFAKS